MVAMMAPAIISLMLHSEVLAQTQGDSEALAVVFGGEYLAENSETIRHKAARLEPPDRYRMLADFVLPSKSHAQLRLAVSFIPITSAYAVPDTVEDTGRTVRKPTGGTIESPALDLIRVAKQLDRLTEVRNRIESASASGSKEDQIARLAGLVLVHCAADEFETATKHLAELYAIVSAGRELHEDSESALLLAVLSGTRHPATRPAAIDLAYHLMETHLDIVTPNEWRPFHRYLAAVTHQAFVAADDNGDVRGGTAAEEVSVAEFQQWQSGSLFTARSRGTGCPPNVWGRSGTDVRKTSGHSIDLLYFQSPLRGDFEVECDASEFSWRSIHTTYAGHWAGVEPKRMRRRIGTLADVNSILLPLDSQMTKFRHEIHYRVSVQQQQLSIYGNGRLLHSTPLPRDHDPWVALRRSQKHTARVWNVRISGEPDIPEEIRLSESPDLTGWIPYFDETMGDSNADWQQVGSGPDGGMIAGRLQPELPAGSYAERLLYYHRPMLEDGSIEYEFFYKEGESLTHPAIDRTAFMLETDGVRIHRVTNGVFDRTGLSPDNMTTESANRRGPAALPLLDNQWNRVRVQLSGNIIDLYLNDEHIYHHPLEATNQRNFGIFHYADQSHAVVRHVTWQGNWPRELPTLYEQELAGDDTRSLDESANDLAAEFRHSFKSAQFPLRRFAVSAGEFSDVRPDKEGLHLQRQGSGRYQRTALTAQLAVGGDFDITASFDSLVTRPCDTGHCSFSISLILADEAVTQTNYRRRHNGYDQREDQQLAYADVVSYLKGEPRRSNIGYKPAESKSGTLRVARRGNRLYTLYAEGDSPSFRITGESDFPEDDVQLGGIILTALTFKESDISFRLKQFTVRAERITGPAYEAPTSKAVLAELNKRRRELPIAGDFDFSRKGPSEEDFYRWGAILPWDTKAGGLEIQHTGRKTWSASGMAPHREIGGDFDITAEFELQKIVNPEAGVRSIVFLKTIFGPQRATQASLMFDINAKGDRQIYGRLGTRRPDGGYNYRNAGGIPTSDISVMRIARYGTSMYFLARRDMNSPEKLIATAEVSDEPVLGRAANFMLHNDGEGRETHLLLKSLTIRAKKYAATNSPLRFRVNPPANPEPKSKSFFESVIDFFK